MGTTLPRTDDPNDLPEPARSQEAFGFSTPRPPSRKNREDWETREDFDARVPDIQDLQRVPGPEAAQFRKDNPGADMYDWQRYQRQQGRGGGR